jgi:hypothetical protein
MNFFWTFQIYFKGDTELEDCCSPCLDKYLKLLIDLPLESLLLFEDAYLATISWRFIVLYYKKWRLKVR